MGRTINQLQSRFQKRKRGNLLILLDVCSIETRTKNVVNPWQMRTSWNKSPENILYEHQFWSRVYFSFPSLIKFRHTPISFLLLFNVHTNVSVSHSFIYWIQPTYWFLLIFKTGEVSHHRGAERSTLIGPTPSRTAPPTLSESKHGHE